MAVGTRSCVERLFREHGSALEAFLYRRTGSHADAIELAQETYLRMLQIKDMDAIRTPKAYMFSVAANLAAEHGVRQGRARGTLDISDPVLEAELSHDPGFADQMDRARSTAQVREVLAELPGTTFRIPMREGIRSLNLSTSAAIVLYEALRRAATVAGRGFGNAGRM